MLTYPRRFTIPLSLLCLVQIPFIPLNRVKGNVRQRLAQVDYLGSILSTVSVLLLLVYLLKLKLIG
jgi:hypothetical protein